MNWVHKSIAVAILWVACAAIAVTAFTFGSAVLSLVGVMPDGSARHGFEFATGNFEYVAAGALAVSAMLVYSGSVRTRPAASEG